MEGVDLVVSIIGLLLLPYMGITARLHTRMQRIQDKTEEVYTKKETKDLINLIISPIKENLDRLIDSQSKLIVALHDLEIKIVSSSKKNDESL